MTKSDTVRMVLNKLFELYEIDTSSIWPDDRLEEIGINQEMTTRILQLCFKELGLNSQAELASTKLPETVRALVEVVYSRVSSSVEREAA
jgi:hypothetical protein